MSISDRYYVRRNTTTTIDVTGLQNTATNGWLNSATVTATLLDHDGTTNAAAEFPVNLFYVAASNGNYRGYVLKTFNQTIGHNYQIKVVATEDGVQLTRIVACSVID